MTTLTALAILFVIGLIAAIFYGFGIIMRRSPTSEEAAIERCSICRKHFPKDTMVEREIGDYKVLHFCAPCVDLLVRDLQAPNLPSASSGHS